MQAFYCILGILGLITLILVYIFIIKWHKKNATKRERSTISTRDYQIIENFVNKQVQISPERGNWISGNFSNGDIQNIINKLNNFKELDNSEKNEVLDKVTIIYIIERRKKFE